MLVSATPQGIACLIITAVGFLNSANKDRPALKSFKLLKESALPLSCLKNLSLLLLKPKILAAWCGFSPYLRSSILCPSNNKYSS